MYICERPVKTARHLSTHQTPTIYHKRTFVSGPCIKHETVECMRSDFCETSGQARPMISNCQQIDIHVRASPIQFNRDNVSSKQGTACIYLWIATMVTCMYNIPQSCNKDCWYRKLEVLRRQIWEM